MKVGRNVKTKSYSLPFEMIDWVKNYGKSSRRTESQVIQLAVDFFRNKISSKNEPIIG